MIRQFEETKTDGTQGELIFAQMLTRLEIEFEQSHEKRDMRDRAVADFTLHLPSPHNAPGPRTVHADVKFHSAWHWLPEDNAWQAGIGAELLHSYAMRASEQRTQCFIFMIKRGLQTFNRDGVAYKRISPSGVWYVDAAQLLAHGFSHKIPNERSIGCCSFRLCDGGLWRPFAPYDERRRMVITSEQDGPALWHQFWSSERCTDIVWP